MHIIGLILLAALLGFCFFNYELVFVFAGWIILRLLKLAIFGGLALFIFFTFIYPTVDPSARTPAVMFGFVLVITSAFWIGWNVFWRYKQQEAERAVWKAAALEQEEAQKRWEASAEGKKEIALRRKLEANRQELDALTAKEARMGKLYSVLFIASDNTSYRRILGGMYIRAADDDDAEKQADQAGQNPPGSTIEVHRASYATALKFNKEEVLGHFLSESQLWELG